jgi:hypothetical protein
MKLPSIKKILTENFAEFEWAPRLLEPLNTFIEAIVQGLNNQLTIGENMDGVVQRVLIDGNYPVRFKWKPTMRPTVAWIGAIHALSGEYMGGAAVSLAWGYDGEGNFIIKDVPGLSASVANKYYITIIALSG